MKTAMQFGALDGTRGFARKLWNSLNDGGNWGIPRCGLIYEKRESERKLVLVQRIPWFEGLSVTPEELREAQEHDHDGVIRMFNAIGVGVPDES